MRRGRWSSSPRFCWAKACLEDIEVILGVGGEGDAAEDFGELRGAEGVKGVGFGHRAGAVDDVNDADETVRVCALIAVAADSGGDAPDDGGAGPSVDEACDVTQTVGGRRPRQFGG